MQFLGEKLRKLKEYQAKHDVEVHKMETKTDKSLEELRVDLVRFLPGGNSDFLVWYIMGQFAKLREK